MQQYNYLQKFRCFLISTKVSKFLLQRFEQSLDVLHSLLCLTTCCAMCAFMSIERSLVISKVQL